VKKIVDAKPKQEIEEQEVDSEEELEELTQKAR